MSKQHQLFRIALIESEKVFDRRRALDEHHELIERPWKQIERNRIPKNIRIDAEEELICKCSRFDPNPCGLDSSCHNRSLLIECGVGFHFILFSF